MWPSWFEAHKWLTYCLKGIVFCFYCCFAYTNSSLRLFGNQHDLSLVQTGFNNWKRAKEKFQHRELSRLHVEATASYQCLSQPSLASQLSLQLKRDQHFYREMLLKQLSALKFLLQQGIAVRGHTESESNLIQLLLEKSSDVSELKKWIA